MSEGYFKRTAARVQHGQPPQANSALLTQVQQQRNMSAAATTEPPRVYISEEELNERIRRIKSEPTNISPNNPAAHRSLLPPAAPEVRNKKCLVLDVDETLVHSSFDSSSNFDIHLSIPQEPQKVTYDVYVGLRPGLHEFLRDIAPHFEIVIFTASLSIYCNPLMDRVDENRILGPLRLFREHCSLVQGSYVKDLSLLGRDLSKVVIVDNSAIAYLFQQRNAIPIKSWFHDKNDTELKKLVPLLMDIVKADTVYDVLDRYNARLQLEAEKLGGALPN